MQYRTFEKNGQDISLLGIGTMRLPLDAEGKVDEQEAIGLIRHGIDCGINYVDTAYMYHDGASEVITGKALKDGYREKVILADKMPVWLAKSEEEMQQIFYTQLNRLNENCIDMYLLHNVTSGILRRAAKFNTMKFLEERRAAGQIKHIGFSFHDDLSVFKETVDMYPWDFCQIQFNYMDANYQAGVEGLKYAASKGLQVIVMEPLRGGKLTDMLPVSVQEFWSRAEIQRTPAEWALRWVANFPEVLTILSGMSTMPQLEENIRVLSDALPCSLTDKEHRIIESVADEYNALIKYPCTACKYCMPCPQKIDIPEVISLYNEWFLYEGNQKIKGNYNLNLPEGRRASACVGCEACQGHCPQHLPVAEIMKKAVEIFE